MKKYRPDPLTPAQRERQSHREGGRYAKVNPCQGCGKSAGVDYCSHPLTDNGDWHDTAICLCKKCANATSDMTNVDDFLKYQKEHGGHQ